MLRFDLLYFTPSSANSWAAVVHREACWSKKDSSLFLKIFIIIPGNNDYRMKVLVIVKISTWN